MPVISTTGEASADHSLGGDEAVLLSPERVQIVLNFDGRVVQYIGCDRYESSSTPTEPPAFELIPCNRRDFRRELYDLSCVVEQLRFEFLSQVRQKHLESETQTEVDRRPSRKIFLQMLLQTKLDNLSKPPGFQLVRPDWEIQSEFEAVRQSFVDDFPTMVDHEFYKQRRQQIADVHEVILAIERYVQVDLPLRERIVRDRRELVERLASSAEGLKPQRVQFYIDDEGYGSGTLGIHKILARSIRTIAPQLEPHIYGVVRASGTETFFPVGNVDGISFFTCKASDLEELRDRAQVHIYGHVGQDLMLAAREQGDCVVNVTGAPGLPLSHKLDFMSSVATAAYYGQSVSFCLQDSFGTYPLDLELANRAAKAEKLELDELLRERSEWLKNSAGAWKETLGHLASSQGWNVESCVWSWAYFTDPQAFLDEMTLLSKSFRGKEFKEEGFFMPEGRQIVIFASRSRYPVRPVDLAEWNNLGITVVSESQGVVAPPAEIPSVPVTIVWTEGISNLQVRSLVSELVGSCHRDDGGQRIQFPLFCTGNASYSEALSSGRIVLHDRYDMGQGQAVPLIRYLWQRVADVRGLGADEAPLFIESASKDMEMGCSGHGERYLNLADWTRSMAEFSRDIMLFNSAYDIVDMICRHQRVPHQGGSL